MALGPIAIAGRAAVARALAPEITAADRAAVARIAGLHAVGGALGQEEEQEISVPVRSSCISSLSWRDETVTVTFHRGGSGSYDYPCSIELFKEFVNAPSVGAFFNSHFR